MVKKIIGTVRRPGAEAERTERKRTVTVEPYKGACAKRFVGSRSFVWFDRDIKPRLLCLSMRHVVDIGRFNVFVPVQAVQSAQKRFNPPSWRIFGRGNLNICWSYIVEMMAQSGVARPSNVLPGGSSTPDTSANSDGESSKSRAFAGFMRFLGQWEYRWMRGWMMRVSRVRTRAVMVVAV